MKNLAQKVSEELLNLATVHAKNIAAWADTPYVAAPFESAFQNRGSTKIKFLNQKIALLKVRRMSHII